MRLVRGLGLVFFRLGFGEVPELAELIALPNAHGVVGGVTTRGVGIWLFGDVLVYLVCEVDGYQRRARTHKCRAIVFLFLCAWFECWR